jgi:glycerol-3-phosphate acyltransferase PlsX
MMRIAIDAMGGDCGPRAVIAGALAAARDLSIGLTLVGRKAEVRAEVDRLQVKPKVHVIIADADEVIGMDEAPSAALRRKPRASIRIAAGVVRRGDAAALFSAGSTGATVIAACGAFGMLEGVGRPALAATVPTARGTAVLLDAGANATCRPRHLVQFAVMGAGYARVAAGIQQPRVGLLSTGAEETKGNALTREAHPLLKGAGVNFIGNVEAHEVYRGVADVIVCDGFTGNVALKISEGLAEMMNDMLGDEIVPSPGATGLLAAPLLGVAGLVLVGHGRSSARAVQNAVTMAHRFACHDIVGRIGREIAAQGAKRR